MNFAISEKLANEIINYLAYRPMIEVEQLVVGLRAIQPITIEEPKETENQ